MREWIDLVETWLKNVETPYGRADIYENPSRGEVNKLIREARREHPGETMPLRASIGPDGTLYVWKAGEGTHSHIQPHVGTIGGYLYLADDYVFFNDLHWEYNEDDDEAWERGKIYGPWVRNYYRATKENPHIQRIYGPNPKIIAVDDEDRGGLGLQGPFEMTDEFVAKHVA